MLSSTARWCLSSRFLVARECHQCRFGTGLCVVQLGVHSSVVFRPSGDALNDDLVECSDEPGPEVSDDDDDDAAAAAAENVRPKPKPKPAPACPPRAGPRPPWSSSEELGGAWSGFGPPGVLCL